MPRLASIEDTARHLGCSPRTVRNYISKGFFPAYKRPRVRGLILNLDEVDRAMASIPARRAHAGVGSYGRTRTSRPSRNSPRSSLAVMRRDHHAQRRPGTPRRCAAAHPCHRRRRSRRAQPRRANDAGTR